jgi:hypothetical protein
MSSTEAVDTSYTQPLPERDERPIAQTGGPDEAQALVHASHNRHLTDAERLRLAALTWTPDETLERFRLIRDRHPDLFEHVLNGYRLALETYEPIREAAAAAGRTVPEPAPGLIAEMYGLAELFRETAELPADLVGVADRHRAAFREAIGRPDFDAALREFAAWLADVARLNAFAARRARAQRAFGHSEGDGQQRPPRFLDELEQAVGGSVTVTMPPLR